MSDHFLSAPLAASMARRISVIVPLGTLSTTSPVAVLRTSVVCSLSESAGSPAIHILAIGVLRNSCRKLEKNQVHRWKSTIPVAERLPHRCFVASERLLTVLFERQ